MNLMTKEIDNYKLASFNQYFKQLSFTGIALIWLFTGGLFNNNIKYLFYIFILTLLGLLLDFFVIALDVFKISFFKKKFKFLLVVFQMVIVIILFFGIMWYFISSEITLVPINEVMDS